jgi:antitoxin component YwqK of YwqJK toxin-antitoxin module
MEKISSDDLYPKYDSDTEESVYYLDEAMTIPFTGVMLDYSKGKLVWECEIKDGYREGIEKTYYGDTGELETVSEVKYNTICGIQREYYKSGKIKHKSILIRNAPIDSVSYDEDGNIIARETVSKENYPRGYYYNWNEVTEYRKKYNLDENEESLVQKDNEEL